MTASQLVTIFLLAISCNLDNVGVGIAYGARGDWHSLGLQSPDRLDYGRRHRALYNFRAADLPVFAIRGGVILGAVLLIGMGVWVIRQENQGAKPRGQEPPV